MRPIDDLINIEDPGWVIVKQWIDRAKNKVKILPADEKRAKNALYNIQVTTRSPMGSIIYMTGGLLVDNGWIRILGSGDEVLNRAISDWNKGKSIEKFGDMPSYLLIADDVIGGFFLLNGGGLGTDLGKVYYLAPDHLTYEPLGLSYSNFLLFCFNNNLDDFYKGYRWSGWQKDVSELSGDEVYTFYPYLWSKEALDLEAITKTVVPIEEQYHLTMDFRKQLGITE